MEIVSTNNIIVKRYYLFGMTTPKRWHPTDMLRIGHQLFSKINKRKRFANHNHDIHFLAREIKDWLPQGIQSMIAGHYWPKHLHRYYFSDETVDHVHITDRIFQHILLKQLKPTLTHAINPNCLHIFGPHGVKLATMRIHQALEKDQPKYVIRADIKSYYASIPHYKLLRDIKATYHDPKVIAMLERVIENPIETPRGINNPHQGIALRGRKKSRIGPIQNGFHFLGIHYPGTQTPDNTTAPHANSALNIEGGGA